MTSRSYIKLFVDCGSRISDFGLAALPVILSTAKNLLVVSRESLVLVFRESCSRNVTSVLFALLLMLSGGAQAQETVDITAPMSVSFYVLDAGAITYADENPTRISFADASLAAGCSLRISVKAQVADFDPPGGSDIPASRVAWTTSGAVGGSGSNGQLSSVTYTQVFQSDPNPTSGRIDLSWSLSAPGSGILAGNHTLFIRWKVESVAP